MHAFAKRASEAEGSPVLENREKIIDNREKIIDNREKIIDMDKRKLLYDAASKYYNVGSEEEFYGYLEDEDNRKALYEDMTQKKGVKFKSKTFDDWDVSLGYSEWVYEDEDNVSENSGVENPLKTNYSIDDAPYEVPSGKSEEGEVKSEEGRGTGDFSALKTKYGIDDAPYEVPSGKSQEGIGAVNREERIVERDELRVKRERGRRVREIYMRCMMR